MTQPEALRLADALRDSVETDGEWSQEQVVAAAAELRRLAKVEAQRDELLAALKLMLASHDATCPGEECQLSGVDLARAAIAKAEKP